MSNPFLRILAFLAGQQETAESLAKPEDPPPVTWLQPGSKAEVIDYGLGAAQRSADMTSSSLDQIQGKAAAQVVLVVGLFPFAVAATGLAVSVHHGARYRTMSIVAFVLTDLFLLASAVMAFLASGLVKAVGLNIARLSEDPAPQEEDLKRNEALVWHKAAWNAMVTINKRASDLFRSRQFLLYGLVSAALGAALLGLAYARPH